MGSTADGSHERFARDSARSYSPVTGTAGSPSFRGAAARTLSLDRNWLFGGPLPTDSARRGLDGVGLERVTLPHTVTDLPWRQWDPADWEHRWGYRREFDLPSGHAGLRWFLDFGAALTGAVVLLNGHTVGEHLGGYLPFGSEVTERLRERGNTLTVLLDARFHLNVPPNRPEPSAPNTSVDFWQPGGLYRGVSLHGVPEVFLADVFAGPVDVLDSGRRVDVRCTLDAARVPDGQAWVRVVLRDGSRVLAESAEPVRIDEPGRVTTDLVLQNPGNVALWSHDNPRRYDVVTTLFTAGYAVHEHRVRIGFRDARFTTEGFFLNGERLRLFGLNRHQFFPFAGAAMSDRVQRRDAEILRAELNCTMVRCSHYPQSEAFLDACDELGLMVFEEAAGWGRYIGDEQWRDYVVRDVGEMVVRDRNRPSVVLWGARLNENLDDVELWTRTRELAHALDGTRPTTGAMIGGSHDTPNFVQDVFSFNDYGGRDGVPRLAPPRTDRPYLVSEAVGTLSGPAKFYRRTDPVDVQQAQAIAHARVHEQAASDSRYCGLLAWCGYDYPSGTGNHFRGVKTPGVLDLFREPKPGAAIYRSQVDPRVRPVIEPAFYWDFGPSAPPNGPGTAMICSNCDRLELAVGGEPFATVLPDGKRFGNLPYPPSFVELTVDPAGLPELRIDGYLGDHRVLSRSFAGDPSGDVLAVRADDGELVADGIDTTRVVFRALDRYGAARPYVGGEVTISVDGPGTLVGENSFAFGAAGGVGAVWVRSRYSAPGDVRVTARHPKLGVGTATLVTRMASRVPK